MYKLEIIQQLKSLLANAKYQAVYNPDEDIFRRDAEALEAAIAAFRPVSRERVAQVWGGCEWCDEEWGTCNPITNRFTMPPRGGIRFCPMCGKPLTDEAVDILLRRLEALHGQKNP